MIEVQDAKEQIAALMAEVVRIMGIKPDLGWSDFAILARTRELLHPVRAMCELRNIPFAWTFGRETVPPLHRLREVARFLCSLKTFNKTRIRASEAQSILSQTAADSGDNPWWALIKEFIHGYEEETGDAALPVPSLIESLYDSLVELRREQSIGNGVFLGTLHGAKGMEFSHVFILDGGWRQEVDSPKREEERRIFYVGMTRAKQTLCLFRRKDLRNPHVEFVSGDSVMERQLIGLEEIPEQVMHLRYEPLSLADLYISSAGKYPATHPIHSHLFRLGPGATLSMRRIEDRVGLFDDEGICIALLSRQGASQWMDRLSKVKAVRIIGMTLREKRFEADEYRGQCQADSWEVPWVEIVWTP
jgi:ATP-dependent DNA helicase RecQ